MSDQISVSVEPPNLLVEVELAPALGATMELSYDLVDILNFEGENADEVEIIDSHWHGIVLEGPENETHHIDLRDVDELTDDD